ncbi:MAG: hypothetical protein NVS4B11_29270 [Ktedonobacteraceae bacterium]
MLWTQRGTRSTSRAFTNVAMLLFAVVLLASCGADTSTVKPTPTPLSLHFTTLNLHIPQKAYAAPVTGSVPDSQSLHIGVSFKLNQAILDKLKNQKKGDTKDATTLANQLGISDEEYQHIKAFFGIDNATLNLGKLHTYMTVDAKAGTIAHLLQTKFVLHKLSGRTFYTPDASMPPKLPTLIASQIIAVTGLDTYGLPTQQQLALKNRHTGRAQSTRKAADSCTPNQGYTTQQIAHAYSYDSLWQSGLHGENMTISLLETDGIPGGSANPDLQTFFNCVGYKGTFSQQSIDGPQPPPAGIGEADEALLDVNMVAGMAPAVNIVDYEMSNRSFQAMNDALQKVLNDNASNTSGAGIVSISLGLAETKLTEGDQQDMTAIDSTLQQITQVDKMTVFTASGDCGAFTSGVYNDLSVNFPASDPWVVAVGGTKLSVNTNGNRTGEQVWSDGGQDQNTCNNSWGSGGGVSVVFQRPDWQQGTGTDNKYTTGKRELPDIAAVATDLNEYQQGGWAGVGGTSAATPIWAAGMVLTNQAIMQKTSSGSNGGAFFYAPDTFYTVASKAGSSQPFYDVTQGNNLYYAATPGWDDATGLGTPNLLDFTNDLYHMTQTQ